MVAMSGAIMPAPLAMPLMRDRRRRRASTVRGRHLREGVGGHDRAGRRPANGPAARAWRSSASTPSNLRGVERLADHAGRGEEDLVAAQPAALRGDARRSARPLRARLAGEGIGIAGIDDERARRAAGQSWPRHQSTGADGHFERVKTPATVVPASNSGEQHVGAALVADAGLGRREADAVDRPADRESAWARAARRRVRHGGHRRAVAASARPRVRGRRLGRRPGAGRPRLARTARIAGRLAVCRRRRGLHVA